LANVTRALMTPGGDRVPCSVIIAAKDEADEIAECIASVAWAAEIIVVENDSTDETPARLRLWAARNGRVTVICEVVRCRSGATACAAAMAAEVAAPEPSERLTAALRAPSRAAEVT